MQDQRLITRQLLSLRVPDKEDLLVFVKDSASFSSAATRVFVSELRVAERIWTISFVDAMGRTQDLEYNLE
jgi:hypothetical protein